MAAVMEMTVSTHTVTKKEGELFSISMSIRIGSIPNGRLHINHKEANKKHKYNKNHKTSLLKRVLLKWLILVM